MQVHEDVRIRLVCKVSLDRFVGAVGVTDEDLRVLSIIVSRRVSVSNSLSGGNRELDEVSAVRDPTHLTQISRAHRVATGERQRRVTLQ